MKLFSIGASALLLFGALNGTLSLIGLGDPVLIQPHDQCGYMLQPNQNHYRFFVHTRINSHSMRSSEFPAQQAEHVARITLLGAQHPYGTTRVDQNNIFTEIVRRDLPSKCHEEIEVLNASANAWGIPNELGYIRSHGIFSSDLVVLVLNDGDLSQRKSTIKDVGTQLYLSRPACALCEAVGHYARRQDQGTTDEKSSSLQEANLRDLSVFHGLVQASHSKMVILFVPFRKHLANATTSVIQPELTRWAQTAVVPVIDTTPSLGSLTISQASIDGGTHLSAVGNMVVATEFESFVEHGFLGHS